MFNLSISIGYSQTDSIPKSLIGFNIETHMRQYHFNSLNENLISAGFNDLIEFQGISLGLSDRYVDKNSYVTATLTWLFSTEMGNANKKATINILDISTEMHWVLSKSPKWFIYPYLGFGYGLSILNLSEKVNNSFNTSIQNLSVQDKNVKNYFSDPLLFIDIGAGIDRKIHIFKNNYYVGLSLGYRLSTNSKWNIESSPLVRYSVFEMKARIRFEYINKIISRPKYYRPIYYKHIY
jgi:hypothetical protein